MLITQMNTTAVSCLHATVSWFLMQSVVSVACTSTQWKCPSGLCIFLNWRCDKHNDCGDGADEAGCPTPSLSKLTHLHGTVSWFLMQPVVSVACTSTQWKCPSGLCIFLNWRCDKHNDCGDGADEAGCPTPSLSKLTHLHGTVSWFLMQPVVSVACTSTQWKCPSGLCIFLNWRCDKHNDCGDGADEAGCPTPSLSKLTHLHGTVSWFLMQPVVSVACTSTQWKCPSGPCISLN